MPNIKFESFGGGDMSWLASDHGIFQCKTFAVDGSANAKDGVLLSGTPLYAGAKDGSVTSKSGTAHVGYVFGDLELDSKNAANGPVLMHGFVKPERLPVQVTGTVSAHIIEIKGDKPAVKGV